MSLNNNNNDNKKEGEEKSISKKKDNKSKDDDFEEQYNILFCSTIDKTTLRQNTMKSVDLNIDKELAQSKINIKLNEKKNYLSSRKWDYLNDNSIDKLNKKINQVYKNMNKKQLEILSNQIEKCVLDHIYNNFNPRESLSTIGTLSSLDYLIETTYYSQPGSVNLMFADKKKLEPYLYKFRTVLGDGDCFYRGLIFSFFENIILTNNVMLMKELLILFDEKMNTKNPLIKEKDYLKQIEKLNIDIVSQALYILIKKMENNKALIVYEILLKLFLYCKDFDYVIIFFTRYLLFDYISSNEDKIFSKENQIEIGCLLPEDFVVDKGVKNEYLFENFYSLQLMRPKSFAEKIVIYIAPFVFNSDINILIYDYGANSFIEEKNFVNEKKKSEFQINLLFRKAHYDIYYKKDFYDKNKDRLDRLLNILENICYLNAKNPEELLKNNNKNKDNNQGIIKEENYEKIFAEQGNNNDNIPKCLGCQKPFKDRENVFGLCQNCLLFELKSQILVAYLEYLKKGKNYMGSEEKLHSFFQNIKCSISVQTNISLTNAIFNSGYNFKDLFLEVRKTICLYCGFSINGDNFYIELPCQCRICKKDCFDGYIKHIKDNLEISENQMGDRCFLSLNCFCGFRYDLKALIYMINETKKKELKDESKIYQDFIKKYSKWKCMICGENFNIHSQYYRIIFKDDKIDSKILKLIDSQHLICYSCASNFNFKSIQTIDCQFCKSKHIFKGIKEVDHNNESEGDCIII